MEEDIKSGIDGLFAAKKEKEDKIQKIKEERETKEEAFLNDFYKARESLIKPALEEIKSYLEEQGYKSFISESDRDYSNQACKVAYITIHFGKDQIYESNKYPHFTVSADSNAQKVQFHESTIGPSHGGHSGGAGDCELSALTSEMLHQKMMKVLKEIL